MKLSELNKGDSVIWNDPETGEQYCAKVHELPKDKDNPTYQRLSIDIGSTFRALVTVEAKDVVKVQN